MGSHSKGQPRQDGCGALARATAPPAGDELARWTCIFDDLFVTPAAEGTEGATCPLCGAPLGAGEAEVFSTAIDGETMSSGGGGGPPAPDPFARGGEMTQLTFCPHSGRVYAKALVGRFRGESEDGLRERMRTARELLAAMGGRPEVDPRQELWQQAEFLDNVLEFELLRPCGCRRPHGEMPELPM